MNYRLIWWAAFALLSSPLLWLGVLAFGGVSGGLGANPIEFLNRYLGDWALRMVLVALAMTPLKVLFGWTWPVRLRRMTGLFAFTFVTLHITSYVALDQFFDWPAIWADIVKRKYITAGMAAYVMLAALAATSTSGAVKRLGARAWMRLHRLVYAAAALGCLHYFWMVKADLAGPMAHAGVLAALLGVRAAARIKRASRST